MNLEPHVKRIAIVVILGAIMSVLDTTIVNVALETLSVELHAPLDSVQWVVTGYMLALAAVIPVTGWAAARFGARRLYIISLVLFTAGSALCGLAWSLESLIAARVLQGLGGGLLVPIGQIDPRQGRRPAQHGARHERDRRPDHPRPRLRPHARRPARSSTSAGSAIFFVNVPVGIVAVIAALRLLPRDEIAARRRRPARRHRPRRWSPPASSASPTASPRAAPPARWLATPVLVPAPARPRPDRDLRRPRAEDREPAARRPPVRQQAFAAASVTTFGLGAALFGAMVLMPLYFQIVRGEDAVVTGLLLIPQGIGAALAMGLSGRVTERFGGGLTVADRRRDHDRRHAPLRPDRRRHVLLASSAPRWSCAASASACR